MQPENAHANGLTGSKHACKACSPWTNWFCSRGFMSACCFDYACQIFAVLTAGKLFFLEVAGPWQFQCQFLVHPRMSGLSLYTLSRTFRLMVAPGPWQFQCQFLVRPRMSGLRPHLPVQDCFCSAGYSIQYTQEGLMPVCQPTSGSFSLGAAIGIALGGFSLLAVLGLLAAWLVIISWSRLDAIAKRRAKQAGPPGQQTHAFSSELHFFTWECKIMCGIRLCVLCC